MKSRFRALAPVACLALALTVSACDTGSDDKAPETRAEPGTATATPEADVTASPAADAKVIPITLDGTTVSPSAERVKIATGQPVVFRISSTVSGQLHIHASPEERVDFAAGDSEITLTFDVPGVIDVEDHDLDALIVQLEVS